ncbi:hypothetical protein SBRY_40108 [Actinacidiphila bryophytorum]|uniref:Uncharacterized protein n=1 Tax=Actinacidiphila bryophytorum TaxID=1436133 RepID=A0A9W4H2A7_9ACTN|nr:hypothetical protein SBRY_40108 [Actinacidiphila bryophytorum]
MRHAGVHAEGRGLGRERCVGARGRLARAFPVLAGRCAGALRPAALRPGAGAAGTCVTAGYRVWAS